MIAERAPADPLEAVDVRRGVVVDIAGVPVALSASDSRRADAVASLFRHAARASTPAVAAVRFDGEAIGLPPEAPTFTVPHAELWYGSDHALFIRSDDGLTASADRDLVAVGGTSAALAREFRFVCLTALAHLLIRRGWQLLHGAALGVSGGAVVVLGNTGTGKSTLAFAALRRGWPVLADDAVLLERRDGFVRVRGFPRPIAVPADVIGPGADPGTDGGRPVPDDPRDRTELGRGTLTAGDLPVVALLVTRGPGAGSGQSVVDPVPAQEVFRSVLRASTSLADPASRPGLFPLAGALARLPAWSVGQAADPVNALDHATRTLAALDDALRSADRSPGHS